MANRSSIMSGRVSVCSKRENDDGKRQFYFLLRLFRLLVFLQDAALTPHRTGIPFSCFELVRKSKGKEKSR